MGACLTVGLLNKGVSLPPSAILRAPDDKVIMAPATDIDSTEYGQIQHLDQMSTNASRVFRPPRLFANRAWSSAVH